MRKYEICAIIDPDVDDRQVTGLLEKSLAGFKADGGVVESVEVAGRRRLAYDIQKKAEGIYVFLKVTSEPGVVKELDRHFTLDESIMRTKVFRDDFKKAAVKKAEPRPEAKAPAARPEGRSSSPRPAPRAEAR
jgi:small subunit ribosomal protein S6